MGTNGSKIKLTWEYLKGVLDGITVRPPIRYDGKVNKNDVAMILTIEDICDVRFIGAKTSNNDFNICTYNINSKNTDIMTIPDYKKHKCTSNFAHSTCELLTERISQYRDNPESIKDEHLRKALSMINNPCMYTQLNGVKRNIEKYARM
jgi:hypothetical protein